LNKKTLLYLFSSILSQFVSIFKSIISPILLTPFQLGYLNLISINIGYLANSHLGILHGMARLAPQFESQRNIKLKNEVYRTSFWFNIFFSFLFLIGFLITSSKKLFLNINDFIIFILIVFFQQLYTFYYIFYRTEHNLNKLTLGSIIQSISILILFPIFLYFFKDKVFAALISLLFSFVFPFFYFVQPFQYYFLNKISLQTSLLILKNGFPILIIGFLDIIFMSVDKFFLSYFYGLEQLGFYSIGILFLSMASSLYGAYGSTLYPQMIKRYTQSGYNSSSRSIILTPVIITSLSLQFIILISLSFAPIIITDYLPKYINSINYIRIFILGSYFFSIATIFLFYLNSINQTKIIRRVQIISILLISLQCIIIVFCKLNYFWISIATVIGYIFYGISISFISLKKILLNRRKQLNRILIKLTLPYFIIILTHLFLPTKFNNVSFNLILLCFIFIINIYLYRKQIKHIIK
jgi:O-antigen/teichoic acid export membrane protein